MVANSGHSLGNQMKFLKGNKWVKLDTPGWCESVSEVVVSELQKHITNKRPFVDYDFYRDGTALGCISSSFLKEGETCKPIYSMSKGYNLPISSGGIELKNALVGLFNMEYEVNLENYLGYMIYLDAITLNVDRHLRNIAVICRNGKPIRPTPIFDNGLSLCSFVKSDDLSLQDLVEISEAQPFNKDFMEQIKLFDNPEITIDSEGLMSKFELVLQKPWNFVPEENQGARARKLVRSIQLLTYRLNQTEGVLWQRS